MIKAILVKITEIPHFLAAKAVSKNPLELLVS